MRSSNTFCKVVYFKEAFPQGEAWWAAEHTIKALVKGSLSPGCYHWKLQILYFSKISTQDYHVMDTIDDERKEGEHC